MDNQKFMDLAKSLVVNYTNAHTDATDNVHIDTDQVYVV